MDAMTVAVLAGSAAAFSAFVLGLVALAASRAPGWRSLRWFAFVAFSAAGYAAFDLGVVLDAPPSVRSVGVQLALTCGVLQAIAWVGYLAASNGRPLRRRHRMFFAAGGVVVVLGLVPGLFVTREISVVAVAWLGVTYHTPALSTFGNIVYVFWIATFAWVAFFWDRVPTSWGALGRCSKSRRARDQRYARERGRSADAALTRLRQRPLDHVGVGRSSTQVRAGRTAARRAVDHARE